MGCARLLPVYDGWVKPRSKSRAPQLPFPGEDDSGEAKKEASSTPSAVHDVSSSQSLLATPTRAAPSKGKPTRSVFCTLGFSILNLSSSSLAAGKRRNMSVTDVSGFHQPAERSETLLVQSAHVSPSSSSLLSPPAVLAEPFSPPSSTVASPSPSVALTDEK